MKSKIKFILFEPSHPGNVGASARAIKTMGFDKLCLINPIEHPHSEARARSSGALDVLLNAEVFDNLHDAIKGCGLIIGTTSRTRRISVPITNIRETAPSIVAEAKQNAVAVIFGPEKSGLINAQVDYCNELVNIPSIGAYKSLNLAKIIPDFPSLLDDFTKVSVLSVFILIFFIIISIKCYWKLDSWIQKTLNNLCDACERFSIEHKWMKMRLIS